MQELLYSLRNPADILTLQWFNPDLDTERKEKDWEFRLLLGPWELLHSTVGRHVATILDAAALRLISHRQWIDEVNKAKAIPFEQPTWKWKTPQNLASVSIDSSAVLGDVQLKLETLSGL